MATKGETMLIHRIAYWSPPGAPAEMPSLIAQTVREYIGDSTCTREIQNRVLVVLPGKRTVSPSYIRLFEVFADDEHLDVSTRDADPFTEAVAWGFFWVCVKAWGLHVDPSFLGCLFSGNLAIVPKPPAVDDTADYVPAAAKTE